MQIQVQVGAEPDAKKNPILICCRAVRGGAQPVSPSKLGEHCVQRLFEFCSQEDKLRGRSWLLQKSQRLRSRLQNSACSGQGACLL